MPQSALTLCEVRSKLCLSRSSGLGASLCAEAHIATASRNNGSIFCGIDFMCVGLRILVRESRSWDQAQPARCQRRLFLPACRLLPEPEKGSTPTHTAACRD